MTGAAGPHNLYLALSRKIALMAPLYPILLLGKWLGIGPFVYRHIAQQNAAIRSLRHSHPKKGGLVRRRAADLDAHRGRRCDNIAFWYVLLLILFYFSIMPAPFLGYYGVPFPDGVRRIADIVPSGNLRNPADDDDLRI